MACAFGELAMAVVMQAFADYVDACNKTASGQADDMTKYTLDSIERFAENEMGLYCKFDQDMVLYKMRRMRKHAESGQHDRIKLHPNYYMEKMLRCRIV